MNQIPRIPALVTILVLIMAMIGTRAQTRAQEPAYEQGELRVYVCCASGEADLQIREQINKAFEEAHPGVTIKQEVLPANTNSFEKLQTMIASGDVPDVFDMWEGFVQPYAEAGHLLSLDQYMQPGGLTKDQFDPQILALNSWNGQLYSLPIEYVPYPAGLYYNPTLFQEAGLQPPDATWTWTELRDAAIKLTKSDGGDTQQWGLLYDYNFYPQWLSSSGPISSTRTSTRPRKFSTGSGRLSRSSSGGQQREDRCLQPLANLRRRVLGRPAAGCPRILPGCRQRVQSRQRRHILRGRLGRAGLRHRP